MKLWKIVQSASKDDFIMQGAIGGLFGTFAMDLFNFVMYKIGISEVLWGSYVATILMPVRDTKKPKNFILGEIEHLLTGILLGIPLSFIFNKTSKKNFLLKGSGYGLVTWASFYNVLTKLGLFQSKDKTTRAYYSTLIQSLIYGLVAAISIKNLGSNRLNRKINTLFEQENPKTFIENSDSKSWEDFRESI